MSAYRRRQIDAIGIVFVLIAGGRRLLRPIMGLVVSRPMRMAASMTRVVIVDVVIVSVVVMRMALSYKAAD
jgi:hypothetical protein